MTSSAFFQVVCVSDQSSLLDALHQSVLAAISQMPHCTGDVTDLSIRAMQQPEAMLDRLDQQRQRHGSLPLLIVDVRSLPFPPDRFLGEASVRLGETAIIAIADSPLTAQPLATAQLFSLVMLPLHSLSFEITIRQALQHFQQQQQWLNHQSHLQQLNARLIGLNEMLVKTVGDRPTPADAESELQDSLRQSEAKFAIAFRASPVIMSITDLTDRRYIEVNDRFLETFGYKRTEVVGRTTLEFNNWHNLESREEFRKMLQTQGAVRGQEHEFVAKSGEIITGIVSADVIPVNGKPCILSVIEDITSRKRIEEALQQAEFSYRSIFENAIDGIFRTTLDGQYLAANPALAQMYGFESAEMFMESGFTSEALYVHPHRRDEFVDLLHQQGSISNFESEVRRRDGSTFWISETARTVHDEDGNLLYYEGSVKDISDRKCTEIALKSAKDAADAANKAKSEFLANMSHELRTPLNAVIGFTQIMLRDGQISYEQQQNIEIIHRAGEHLLDLINDVLEMSKIESGKTVLMTEAFDLHALIDGLYTMLKLKATAQGLDFTMAIAPDVPQYIHSDPRKLRQVLLNLLSNAIKFTETGSVALRAWTGGNCTLSLPNNTPNSATCTLYFEITDTGFGIAEHELTHLFDPFVQTEAGRQSNQGTGLGLPISRKFVQMMGGDIVVRSILQQGSQFEFYIQVSPVQAADLEAIEPDRYVVGLAPGSPQYRILVVDDKWENRQLLMKLLSPVGLSVREAQNGKEAIALWEEWEPHLIWMDMRMPVMDGYEATKHIRAALKGQATVILALTASALEEDRSIVLSAGCNDFVRKPFREADIFAKMSEYLGLEYLYEDTHFPSTRSAAPPLLTTEHLAVMPDAWIKNVFMAARGCDDDQLYALIQDIPPQHSELSAILIQLTDNFQFDHIIQLDQSTHDE